MRVICKTHLKPWTMAFDPFENLVLYRWCDLGRYGIARKKKAVRGQDAELVAVGRGVYVVVENILDTWQAMKRIFAARIVAVAQSLAEPPIFTGETAAFIRGGPIARAVPREITLYQDVGSRAIGKVVGRGPTRHGTTYESDYLNRPTRVRRFKRPPSVEGTPSRLGLLVTSDEVVAVDALRHLPRPDGVLCASGALSAPVLSTRRHASTSATLKKAAREQLAKAVSLLAQLRRRPGNKRARTGLRLTTALSESALETKFLLTCDAWGIPRPAQQVRVGDYWVDACWEKHRITVEIDGAIKYTEHGDPGVLVREKRREDHIRRHDHRMLRLMATDLSEREFAKFAIELPESLQPATPPQWYPRWADRQRTLRAARGG